MARADICLCDNFYTPDQDPQAFAWLVGMVDELSNLVDCFGTPLISGKDSSAGSVATPEGLVSVPPAVYLSALGKAPDAAALRRNEWRREGSLLVRVGPDTAAPAGTVAARALGLDGGGGIDAPDPERYRGYLDALAAAGPVWTAIGTHSAGRPAAAAAAANASVRFGNG